MIMELKVQKRLAAQILKCSRKRIWFDETRLDEIKEAITKEDIRDLISNGAIQIKHQRSHSRGRSRLIQIQKRKGKRKGHGSRKGRKTARSPKKEAWVNRIRSQRKLLKRLRKGNKISKRDYHELYRKCKGGFFRSTRHIKVYIEERGFIKKK